MGGRGCCWACGWGGAGLEALVGVLLEILVNMISERRVDGEMVSGCTNAWQMPN